MLVGFLLAADCFTVAALAIVRPHGWVAPLVPFSIALVGLVGLEAWSLAHRDHVPILIIMNLKEDGVSLPGAVKPPLFSGSFCLMISAWIVTPRWLACPVKSAATW